MSWFMTGKDLIIQLLVFIVIQRHNVLKTESRSETLSSCLKQQLFSNQKHYQMVS